MDSDLSNVHELAEEVEDLLNSRLTEQEYQEVKDAFKAISGQVRWEEVKQALFPRIFQEIERALFQDLGEFADPRYYKNGTAWYNPSWDEVGVLWEEHDSKALIRRHYLTLLMIRKVAGMLKAQVRRSLKNIPILSEEREQELLRTLLGGEEAQEEEVVVKARPRATGRSRGWGRRPRPGPITCPHEKTSKIMVVQGRQRFLRTGCLECGEILGLTPYKGRTRPQALVTDEEEGPCYHPRVQWIPGEEGRRARCTSPECGEEVEDPKAYSWIDAGLEPFGDDPNQDEVITLCSDYS